MAGPLHPQGLDSPGAALVHGQTMGEVDHLVLSTVDHQHWGRHFGHLVNTGEEKQGGEIQDGYVFNSTELLTIKHTVHRAFRHESALKSALMAEQEHGLLEWSCPMFRLSLQQENRSSCLTARQYTNRKDENLTTTTGQCQLMDYNGVHTKNFCQLVFLYQLHDLQRKIPETFK